MKKIDLHVHTIATKSDPHFEFSFDQMKEYVESEQIDCVAITNHNLFDLSQYKKISADLNICVLPGIEIDLEGGHILVIADPCNVEDFATKCQKITNLVTYPHPNVKLDEFKAIFPDLDTYILIPHYDKSPKINKYVLDRLSDYIKAGEVQAHKKFIQTYKNENSLVPVLFSDLRMKNDLKIIQSRQTYLDIGDCSFRSIKLGLTKKDYVSLTKEEGNKFIEIPNSQIKISTGLNVILGKRSSGKSYTLNSISASSEEDDVKYIRQFELLESDDEADRKEFDAHVSKNRSDVTEKYLSPFKLVVDDILTVDSRRDEGDIERYLSSLIDNANNQVRNDAFSKAALFSSPLFTIKDSQVLKELISSTEKLLDNLEYKDLINSHLSRDSLIKLHAELVNKLRQEQKVIKIHQFANEIVEKVKQDLNRKSSQTPIAEIDFRHLALNRVKVRKFSDVVSLIKASKKIDEKPLYGYKVVAERGEFKSATELGQVLRRRMSLKDAFCVYQKPMNYIEKLQEAGVEDTEIYKYFSKISYRILNKFGASVSGGERSEYRLLKKLHDAKDFDILLIDEPESSFDNGFLFNSVNSIIKDLSKQMPVVVVTHNSTVGSSIEPDYLIYTSKTILDGKPVYEVYSGRPTDKYLHTSSGKSIENYLIQLDSLEAGIMPYTKRNEGYESIKS
ncbi:histidinol phosphatase [Pseudoalteromonas sp. G4]|uniref:histidinol phosphatase n=1 Tax=Pseudoalteromonas sp. G4 TaxID=2992761 RepID=UPI00237ED73C|nr:histidinol phosphatase [Pseudoalteromonas sp. G4]MDE3273783.1 histidinol phosphatase [Pseudoalteromonas sp. G4]